MAAKVINPWQVNEASKTEKEAFLEAHLKKKELKEGLQLLREAADAKSFEGEEKPELDWVIEEREGCKVSEAVWGACAVLTPIKATALTDKSKSRLK